MTWQDVCEDPHLQDLPYKVELNRFGQIIMNPASNGRGFQQFEIGSELKSQMQSGRVITECSIQTNDGTRVADVVWGSTQFFEEHGFATPLPVAPEICVEVVSPGNSKEEIRLKIGLYTEAGAKEVWICSTDRKIEFFEGKEKIERSKVVPGFSSEAWE